MLTLSLQLAAIDLDKFIGTAFFGLERNGAEFFVLRGLTGGGNGVNDGGGGR